MNGIITLPVQTGKNTLVGRIVWESAGNGTAENTSTVTASLQIKKTTSTATSGHWRATLHIGDGKTEVNDYHKVSNGWVELATLSATIAHDYYGDGSCVLSGMVIGPGDTSLEGTVLNGGERVTLDKIPRASEYTARNADIGSASYIFISAQDSSFTHTLEYRFYNADGWIDDNGNVSTAAVRLKNREIFFKIPESFYTQIPNAKSGTVELILTTYSGDTAIGEYRDSFTATASRELCAPVLEATVTDTNPDTVALTGDSGVTVQYKSVLLCHMDVTARNGASIAEQYAATQRQSAVVPDADGNARIEQPVRYVNLTATDSRGYTTTVTRTVSLDYQTPASHATVEWDNVGAGTARLTVSGSWWNQSFGAAENVLTVQCQSDGNTVEVPVASDGNKFTATATLSGMDYQRDTTVTVTVSDKLSSASSDIVLHNAQPLYLLSKTGMRYNVPLHAPSINDEAVGALEWHGEFSDLAAVDTFIDSTLKDISLVGGGYPRNRRYALTLDYNAAYLTVHVGRNDDSFPEVFVTLERPSGTLRKTATAEGGTPFEWTWTDWEDTKGSSTEIVLPYQGDYGFMQGVDDFIDEKLAGIGESFPCLLRYAISDGRGGLLTIAATQDDDGFARITVDFDWGGTAVRKTGGSRSPYGNAADEMDWSDWEYVHPPMDRDTEYRTVERWGGSPVYVRLVELTMPNSTTTRVDLGLTTSKVISVEGIVIGNNEAAPMPYISSLAVAANMFIDSRGRLAVRSNKDMSAYTGYFTIKYTK